MATSDLIISVVTSSQFPIAGLTLSYLISIKNAGPDSAANVSLTTLLPSAFFTINKSGDTFVIKGGGFGHGIGMSQTGANEMAKCGKNYQEILTFFYQGVTIG